MAETTRSRVLRLLVISTMALAVSLAASACVASEPPAASKTTAAEDSEEAAMPDLFAKRVNIGDGRSMYIECRGEGSPTVLLLSGGGTASDLWHAADQIGPKVYPEVGTFTRVCAYDRPGAPHLDGELSRSDPVPQPTTPQNGADDLTALLAAVDIDGPYVLAAHSFSGNIARVFAADHPDQVEGIVFIDVLTPELRAQMTPEQWAIWTFGNARPAEAIAEYPALERQDFDESLDQVEAAAPLGQMPVVVLTASVKFAELLPKYIDDGIIPASIPRDFGTVIDTTNAAAQRELAALVPGSVHITDTNSGHNIMVDNAPLVIQSIRDVVDAVRAGKLSMTGD